MEWRAKVKISRQGQRRRLISFDHRRELGLHPKQPMPTNLTVERRDRIIAAVVRRLQSRYGFKEHSQGCWQKGMHLVG